MSTEDGAPASGRPEPAPAAPAGPAAVQRDASGLVIPPPAPVHSGPIALTGTVIFLVAFVALVPFYGWLGDHGHRIWLWTALAGFIEGVLGSLLSYRHRLAGRTL